MAIKYNIDPYRGPLPLEFGMSSEQVLAICGPIASSTENALGELEERRSSIRTRYASGDLKLVEVTFLPGANLLLDGEYLLNTTNPIDICFALDNKPLECVGFIVFLKLGIAIAGFHDDDIDQRSITVFSRGHWDELRSEMTPFRR